MLLCLDVGNSQIFAGLFENQKLILTFRYDSRHRFTSDQFGVFIRSLLREKEIDPMAISHIGMASVVPELDYSIRAGCIKYLDQDPFVLQAGVKTGLKIKYRNPIEVGSDRIANALAAVQQFPNQNIVVVSLGTATTICCISKDKCYLGGAIFPGFSVSMGALQSSTSKLQSVSIARPNEVIGQSTYSAIQSGLYFSQLGAIREFIQQISKREFAYQAPCVIGTGGFCHLFEKEDLFDLTVPDLVLHGIRLAHELNN